MADGTTLSNNDNPCSLLIGSAKNIRNVELNIADNNVKFKIIDLETGVGTIPVAVNEENFDLKKLKKNAVIVMFAYIKADLSC